jgi:hypothetical protein
MILQRVAAPFRGPFAGPGPSFQFQEGDRGFVPERNNYTSSAGASISGSSWTESESQHPDSADWKEPTSDIELCSPEHSPRHGHYHSCASLYELPSAPTPNKDGPEGGVAMAYYMQMPVVFMMVPTDAWPLRPQSSGQHRPNTNTLRLSELISPPESSESLPTETSPRSSTVSLHENSENADDDAPMPAQIERESPCRRPNCIAPRKLPAGFTTIVIRNIPARYTRDMLLEEFEPDGSFDFFFLPYSFRHSKTMGVAFVNFRSHDLALDFQTRWNRCYLSDHGCKNKHLDIAAAAMQGLADNLRQFNAKNVARLNSVGMLPLLLDKGGNRLNSMKELQRYGIVL